jgi:hypothetical protein
MVNICGIYFQLGLFPKTVFIMWVLYQGTIDMDGRLT